MSLLSFLLVVFLFPSKLGFSGGLSWKFWWLELIEEKGHKLVEAVSRPSGPREVPAGVAKVAEEPAEVAA